MTLIPILDKHNVIHCFSAYKTMKSLHYIDIIFLPVFLKFILLILFASSKVYTFTVSVRVIKHLIQFKSEWWKVKLFFSWNIFTELHKDLDLKPYSYHYQVLKYFISYMEASLLDHLNTPYSLESDIICVLRPGLGLIDSLSVDLEPLTHLFESLFKNRDDNSVGCRSHIDQDVTSLTLNKWKT